jgi:hypothetical protein
MNRIMIALAFSMTMVCVGCSSVHEARVVVMDHTNVAVPGASVGVQRMDMPFMSLRAMREFPSYQVGTSNEQGEMHIVLIDGEPFEFEATHPDYVSVSMLVRDWQAAEKDEDNVVYLIFPGKNNEAP